MAAATQPRAWNQPSRRRNLRYQLEAPMDVTVLRSGIPDTLPGRSVNLGERGVAAVLAGELVPGESVGVEIALPLEVGALRARALVRHHDKLRCGLEFVGLSTAQQATIQEWTQKAKSETEAVSAGLNQSAQAGAAPQADAAEDDPGQKPSAGARRRRGRKWLAAMLVAAALAAMIAWWRWHRAWEDLESASAAPDGQLLVPQVQVPAEVMEKLLLHRVEPAYPEEARRANIQGEIILDVVIARDGSVASVRPLNGAPMLYRAAIEAVRWWRFDPYRVDGKAMVVETTVSVMFRR